MKQKSDYGLDQPALQRRSLWGGLAGVLIGSALSFWANSAPQYIALFLTGTGLLLTGTGLLFFLFGGVMYWGSKVGKLHLRDKIIASIAWRGHERVLDVGCGHGLMLLGAAKRLTTGHSTGIDIWSQVAQANNSPEATRENARLENVADRITLQTADARRLPFADGYFDVVVSSFAIHGLRRAAEREQVMCEIARVLKSGGQLAIADIFHTDQYASILRALGWTEVRRWSPNFLFVIPTHVVRARKP